MGLSRLIGLGVALIVAGLGIYAFWIEPRSLVITRLTIETQAMARDANPIKIVAIADVQPAGPHETESRLRDVVARANAESPDLVVLLGDYVTTRHLKTKFVEPAGTTALLGELQAPMGVFAVLGNHDWWWDAGRMRLLLEQQGIRVLDNEVAMAIGPANRLWIAGLADPDGWAPDVAGTLAKTSDVAPVLLLTHNPDVFPEVPESVALTLAGHTHGGQVDLPFLGPLIVPSKYGARYAYGHIIEGGRQLYVSSGIGTAIIPVRFRVPPEIAVITLVAK